MNYDLEQVLHNDAFTKREGIVNDVPVILIFPKKGVDGFWTRDILWARSIMIHRDTHKILSRGFDKFFNYHERVDIEPDPDFLDCEFREKIDGSLLIVSVINGKLNVRTRGTLDAYIQYPNTKVEYDNFIQTKYKDVFDYILEAGEGRSYLFEHTTPRNIIVLNYGAEPKLKLLGIITNETGYLERSDDYLDGFAQLYNIERPQKYVIKASEDVQKLLEIQNIEGFVLYYDGGQKMKKLKTEEYLQKHRVRTQFNHNTLIESWKKHSQLSGDAEYTARELKTILSKEFDYECINFPHLWSWWNSIYQDAYDLFEKVYGIVDTLISEYPIRAEFAKVVKETFSPTEQMIAFMRLKYSDDNEYKNEAFKVLIPRFFEKNKDQIN